MAIVFLHVGLYWLIQPKEQVNFYFDQKFTSWIHDGPWYDTKHLSHFFGSHFEILFTTALQDRYEFMSSIKEYIKLHATCSDYVSSGGGRPLPYGSTTDALKPLCNILNLIDIWL